MDSLSKSLYSVVSEAIEQFASLISDKYDLSKEEVLELWNNGVSSDVKVKDKKPTSTPKEKKPKPPSESTEVKTCKYVFKKGKNNGMTCTSKSCEDSSYCKKHKAQEGKEDEAPVEKKSKPTTTKAKKETKDSSVVSKIKESTPSLVIKKNKHGNYEHVETGLVLDKDTKEVYGRQTDSGVVDLTAEDVETCKRFNFKVRLPQTISKKKEEVEDDDEEEEEDVEEEVEEEEDEEEEVDDE